MKNKTKAINQILADWDPLCVGKDISLDEYRGYLPQIIKHIENREMLTHFLENILINSLETGYEKDNEEHKKTLAAIIEKMTQLL